MPGPGESLIDIASTANMEQPAGLTCQPSFRNRNINLVLFTYSGYNACWRTLIRVHAVEIT